MGNGYSGNYNGRSDYGGGKSQLKCPTTEGNKGLPPGGAYPSKAPIGKQSKIDSPGVKGNRGVTTQTGGSHKGAPKD